MNNTFVRMALCALVSISLLNACKTSKKAAGNKKGNDTTQIAVNRDTTITPSVTFTEPISDAKKPLLDKYTAIWNKPIDFKTFSTKAKCDYEGKGNKQDFTANIRIRKDEALWVTVTALGGIVQVARLYVTPDSFRMINYLEKQYISLHTSDAGKVLPFPVDFSMLQNLFVGNPLHTTGIVRDIIEATDAVSLITEKDKLDQNINYNKADNNIYSLKLHTDSQDAEAVINYNEYADLEGRKFAKARDINVTNKTDKYRLQMDFSDVRFDAPVEMPFSVPKNYSKK